MDKPIVDKLLIPRKLQKELQKDRIKSMYKHGFTYEEIVEIEKVAKTTISFILKGRKAQRKLKTNK